ncbi:uncharacterized protein LMH87_007633 [Akanthomyces muscarius]|uniref:Uncharacterized protein n=1 Tax=Akanthomyces muscarius TaxID=2231603 RepID=A0A9W8UNN2_AKAMU|nr:uncharacterized protein LMH87_007633 [Akanthomyces muscarius]KAJ4161603.1 hypothetical protein LMH87_007633 [Akanthomyces muscarius]
MTGPVTRSTPDTKANALQDILKAAAKCGIPQTRAEALARDGALEGAVKAAMTRQAVRAAFINGTWQSAALTAVFDVKLLFDGQFQQYLVRIGVGGLYGGAVGGLSSWISNPYLKNNIVLGVLIGSSFGLVGLASTGDWARFGKGLGVNIVSGAGGWGGATVGAFALAPFGPLGPPIGGFLGGMAGGWFGSRVAGQVPALSGVTDQEVRTMYEATVAQLAKAGLKPDPKLSARQVAEAMTLSGGRGGGAGDSGATGLPFNVCMTNAMANDVGDLRQSLLVMYEASPDQFTNFLARLRAANAELSPQTIH